MSRFIIGVDPGSKGYATLMGDGLPKKFCPFEDNDKQSIAEWFAEVVTETAGTAKCVMEQVHSMPGQGVSSTFAFGQNFGFVLGILVAMKIPYTLVTPQKWQSEVWDAADKVYTTTIKKDGAPKKTVHTKQTSLNACRRLFPSTDLRKSDRSKNPHDGKCDSLLIAEYGRRKLL